MRWNKFSLGIIVFLVTGHWSLVTVSADWPMVAANPERSSWVSDQVDGDIYAGSIKVEWYRPIDAYIPPNFQVIAANDLVYVASARGLYAFRYDTGEVAWRYDTEIPLGNSPTIASVNGTSMAFVGGYDKKLHTFNALTGAPLWEFAGAQAGFDANPLVINNVVYVGNRDGHFYALNAQNGQLVWQYPAADQPGLGAIRQSPAYKNNTLYFVTEHNYAYALNLNGTLKWRSHNRLVSDGFYAYWPVVYTNPADNHDYVIFSTKIPYREGIRPGTRSFLCDPYWTPDIDPNPCEGYSMYGDNHYLSDTPPEPYPQTVTLSEPWAQGKTILDYSTVKNYLDARPYLKTYPVLNADNGTEAYTVPNFPQANPGPQAPPVIAQDLLFFSNDRGNGRHHIMGWKFGTPYFADTVLDGAGDEPILLSAGGNRIYKVLCCSRAAWTTLLPNLNGQTTLWQYGGNSLGQWAPGYDEKLYYLDPSNPLDNISVIFGNVNGIYGYHSDNNPMVPYQGKLFTLKGNSILAFGSGTQRGKLPLLASQAPSQSIIVPSDTTLRSRLEAEVQKIITAGILKPGYQDDSQFNQPTLKNYFDNPADTLITLSQAYPHLSPSTQNALKSYLKTTFYPRYIQTTLVRRFGWRDGVQRDSIPYPPPLEADMQLLADNYNDTSLDYFATWFFPQYIRANPNVFYGMWLYASTITPEDTQAVYQRAKEILTTGSCQWSDCTHVPIYGTNLDMGATDANLIKYPYELNAYIAGYQGFVNLTTLAGNPSLDNELHQKVATELDRLKTLRSTHFSKDTPFNTAQDYGRNFLNIARNFMWLTPELAANLRQHNLTQVQATLNEYNTVGPYWFVSRFNAAPAESGLANLYDYPSNFQARAWILQAPKQELVKYLDVPAFERGDLFYIQNLVATLEAPSDPNYTPSPQPSTPPPTDTDLNDDLVTDIRDLMFLIANFARVGLGNFNNLGLVDIFDYSILLRNL